MLDRAAEILAQIALFLGGGSIVAYLAREAWLVWRSRQVAKRIHHLRDLFDGSSEDAHAFRLIRRRPSTWRDLEALEHLLEAQRATLDAATSPEASRALFESYDTLGIVDRYITKLQHGRGWAERAFSARFLGEIGSVKAVAPLIAVMRNTREEDRDVRMAASRALGRIRDPRALEPLIAALGAPESWLPSRVAEVLLQFGTAAVDPLVALLGRADDTGARPWAAQILGDIGDPRCVPVLQACLGDLNDQVRARAASALGNLGDRRVVPELIRVMLSDPVPYVRIQVVRALGALGDPRALHHLIDALKDGEWWVRVRVVEALEQLGEQAVDPLFLALEDRDAEVRSRAAMTLERLGVLDQLIEKLKEVDTQARQRLLAAGQVGVVEILIEALENEDARVRFVVAEILGEARFPAVSVALIRRLKEETDGRVRAPIVRSLAQLQDGSAAKPIAELLGDPDERIRIEAVRALERIQVPEPHVLLASAARDPQARVRAGAAIVLGKVGDAEAVPMLLGLLADAEPEVRVEAARALGLLRAQPAVAPLIESFHDFDPAVQIASARALGQIGSPECLEPLVHGLENATPELGTAIAWALGQIHWDDPEQLIDVLFQGTDRSSRLGVLGALSQLGHQSGRELIRSMLEDTDVEIVREAVHRLGQMHDRDALPQLHALLGSPVEETRLVVIDALCRIGDETSWAPLRRAVFDPSDRVRARAVLALGYLRDPDAGDLLRGIVAGERSTPEMRAFALVGLMVLGRAGDLEAILEALRTFPLHEFLHARPRLEDPILRATMERLRESNSVEYMVASVESRADVEAALLRELANAHDKHRRVRVLAALACLGTRTAYPAVWRAFHKDPCEEVRVGALEYLAQTAPPEDFYRLLVDGLNDLQPRVRAESLRRLRDVPIDKALPLVLSHLGSQDDDVHDVLIEYWSGLPEATLDALLDGILGAPLEQRGRRLVARLVGRSRHPNISELLEAFMEEDDAHVRRAAVESLVEVPGKRAQQLIASALQDPDIKVRGGAVDAAAALGPTAGLSLVRLALEDPSPEVRRRAVLRLATLGVKQAATDLRAASRDGDPSVRAAALAVLLLEGSQPIEDWTTVRDVPAIAAALREICSAGTIEHRLATARAVQERVGALKALFFRDSRLRAQALAAARVDPSPRVRATGHKLEEMLAGWLQEPEAEAWLVDAPLPEEDGARAAGVEALDRGAGDSAVSPGTAPSAVAASEAKE